MITSFNQQQKELVQHVFYEIDMLIDTRLLLSSTIDIMKNQIFNNAILESYLLHVRCLAEFFNACSSNRHNLNINLIVDFLYQ